MCHDQSPQIATLNNQSKAASPELHLEYVNEGVPQLFHDSVDVLHESRDPGALVRDLFRFCSEPKVVEVDVGQLPHELLLLGQQKRVESVRFCAVEIENALFKGTVPKAAHAAVHQQNEKRYHAISQACCKHEQEGRQQGTVP